MNIFVNFGNMLIFVICNILFLNNVNTSQNKNNEKVCMKNTDRYVWDEFDNNIVSLIIETERKYEPCTFRNGSCFITIIEHDLKPFQNGITKDTVASMKRRFNAVHYQLINHTLYRDEECTYPTRCNGVEYFLHKFTELDDFDLIINVADYPLSSSAYKPNPVFSFSKTDEFSDIMYPAWSFWSGGPGIKVYPTGLGRWDLHYESMIKESLNWPWFKKKNIAFFRGSRTNAERDVLIMLSRESPDLVDASYTINQAFKSYERDTLGADPADVVKMEYHCRYKYLFNFRGVAASFRFKYLFLCRSLVFHVGDDWKEFFYFQLKPWIHYIPLEKNHTKQQIIELLDFFKRHDDIAKEIADRGFDFIRSHLKMTDIMWYWETLLRKYTKLLKFSPILDSKVVKVKKNKQLNTNHIN